MWALLGNPLAALTVTLAGSVSLIVQADSWASPQSVSFVLTGLGTFIGAVAAAVGAIRLWVKRDRGTVTLTNEQFAELVKRRR